MEGETCRRATGAEGESMSGALEHVYHQAGVPPPPTDSCKAHRLGTPGEQQQQQESPSGEAWAAVCWLPSERVSERAFARRADDEAVPAPTLGEESLHDRTVVERPPTAAQRASLARETVRRAVKSCLMQSTAAGIKYLWRSRAAGIARPHWPGSQGKAKLGSGRCGFTTCSRWGRPINILVSTGWLALFWASRQFCSRRAVDIHTRHSRRSCRK